MSGPFAPLNNLSIQLQVAGSSGQNQQSIELPLERPLAARNIQFQAQQMSMEVKVQGRWQSIALPLESSQSALIGVKIDAANLQIKADGSVLIKPTPIHLPLDKAQQFMALLATLSGQQSTSKAPINQVQLNAQFQGGQTITLAQLNASFHIDKNTAQLLKNGAQLVALELSVQQGKLISQLVLRDGARIPAPLPLDKLSQALIKAAPALQIEVPPSQLQAHVSLKKEHGAIAALIKILSVTLTRTQTSLLAGTPTPTHLQLNSKGQLQLQVPPAPINLKTTLDTISTGPLTLLTSAKLDPSHITNTSSQRPMGITPSIEAAVPKHLMQQQASGQNAALQTNSLWQRAQQHLQLWQASFANKESGSVNQRSGLIPVHQLLQSPAKALLSPLLSVSLARPTPSNVVDSALTTAQLSQLLALKDVRGFSELHASEGARTANEIKQAMLSTTLLSSNNPKQQPPNANSTPSSALSTNAVVAPTAATSFIDAIPSIIRHKSPLLTLIVQMQNVLKASVAPSNTTQFNLHSSATPLVLRPASGFPHAPNSLLSPLLPPPTSNETLLNQVLTPLPLTARIMAPLLKQFAPAQQLTQHMAQLDKALSNAPTELKAMVNQAFSRMMNVTMPAPLMTAQVMAHLQPTSLSAAQYHTSFAGQIDALVTTLASSAIFAAQPQAATGTANTVLMPLINLLMGQAPSSGVADTLMQQLQSPSAQALLADLNFLQQSMSPQSSAPQPAASQDSNPLVQLFLPMRLPPDVGQTHLSLGRYKQKNQKGEYQDVWFVRMQFDYAKLGELSVQAHLCKQTLNCELRANTSQLANLAKQHSDDLRRNLQQHGLGVAQIKVEKVSEQQAQQWQKFYKRHSIVNLKV